MTINNLFFFNFLSKIMNKMISIKFSNQIPKVNIKNL